MSRSVGPASRVRAVERLGMGEDRRRRRSSLRFEFEIVNVIAELNWVAGPAIAVPSSARPASRRPACR